MKQFVRLTRKFHGIAVFLSDEYGNGSVFAEAGRQCRLQITGKTGYGLETGTPIDIFILQSATGHPNKIVRTQKLFL